MKSFSLLLRSLTTTAIAWLLVCRGFAGVGTGTPIRVETDPQKAGIAIADDFLGLSVEMRKLGSAKPTDKPDTAGDKAEKPANKPEKTNDQPPKTSGRRYFSAENKPLVTLMQSIGVKNIRVGGGSSEYKNALLSNEDIDTFFAFAKAANVKVIYTLGLRNNTVEQNVEAAKYIRSHYPLQLSCFALGNEPNIYLREYPVFRQQWQKYMDAIVAPENSPDSRFCGPGPTPGKVRWASDFAHDTAKLEKLILITQHQYPGSAPRNYPDAQSARVAMLSAEWLQRYQKLYDAFVPAAIAYNRPFRLDEANNFFHAGYPGASDTYTASLWVLDYLHWWAQHGASGVNLHTGDDTNLGSKKGPHFPPYAAFVTTENGYNVRPMGYGIKAFDLGSHGKVVPAVVKNAETPLNVTAYSVLSASGSLYVTLINKENGEKKATASITLAAGSTFNRAQTIALTAPDNDIGSLKGVTLGGNTIREDGSFIESWSEPITADKAGEFNVTVPAGSATIVRLTAEKDGEQVKPAAGALKKARNH